MAAAFREACEHMDENIAKVTALRDKLIDGLSKIPHCALNGDREHRLPGNVNFCFEGIEGESMLLLLDGKGICASSGSACTSGSLDPSHVLLAIGRPHEVAHGSLRLTLCESNGSGDRPYSGLRAGDRRLSARHVPGLARSGRGQEIVYSLRRNQLWHCIAKK